MGTVHYHRSLWYVSCYSVAVNNVTLMEQVNPNSGPYQGGTDVNITGTELGFVFSDIINVTIGGESCTINRNGYQSRVG